MAFARDQYRSVYPQNFVGTCCHANLVRSSSQQSGEKLLSFLGMPRFGMTEPLIVPAAIVLVSISSSRPLRGQDLQGNA